MSEQNDIRNDLDVEIFGEIGKTVTFKRQSSPIYNTRGEQEDVTSTDSTITIVPYNITHEERTRQPFGDLPEGSMFAVVRYDQVIDAGDKIEIESEDWEVQLVERNYLPGNVATIVSLTRVQA